MRINNISLKNYRNCKNINLDFSSDKILIIGKNAQGKTNILESVYYLSQLKSPRTSNVKELINFDSEGFSIEAQINKSNTDIDMAIIYENSKRTLKLNGLKTTPKNFKSVLKTVLFSTEDLMLLEVAHKIDEIGWIELYLKFIQLMMKD